jgi:hypothetical protein
VIAELIEELRARGIELRASGATLRVVGSRGAYSAAIRARILANKPEILEHLRREEEIAAASYAREERAWAARYVASLALARGYGHELAGVAATIVGRAPACAPFHVESERIVVAMGEGREVRIHRTRQPWIAAVDVPRHASRPSLSAETTAPRHGPVAASDPDRP